MSHENRAKRAAQTQLVLSERRFRELTSQVKGVYNGIDEALVRALRLQIDMIETAQEIGLEPEIGQKLFDELNGCIGGMVNTRDKMVSAHTRATAIRMRTSQAARSEGCWNWPYGQANEDQSDVQPLRVVG